MKSRQVLVSRSYVERRCPDCVMRYELCICSLSPKLLTQTQLLILMHARERKSTTNTARLAQLALQNCEIRVRGDQTHPVNISDLLSQNVCPLVLYPDESAIELSNEFVASLDKRVLLIVPDGNWRQAAKSIRRESQLQGITKVKLPESVPSRYRLREQSRSGNLCTYEAISRSLEILEGVHLSKAMDSFFDVMVQRTLWSRGRGSGTLASILKKND